MYSHVSERDTHSFWWFLFVRFALKISFGKILTTQMQDSNPEPWKQAPGSLSGSLGVQCGRLGPLGMGGTKERFHQKFPTPREMGIPLALKGNDKRANPKREHQDAFSSSESKSWRES